MKIHEIRFQTADITASEHFYSGVLGLPTRRDASNVIVHAGWTDLVISEAEVSPGAHHLAFTIPRNLFDQAKAWLSERVRLLSANGENEFECSPLWNARSLYFEGPDHNVLELIIRREVPNDSPGHFDGSSILGVSEVGIPAADVDAFQRLTRDRFGLEPYGQGGPEFRPIGDPDGLFIAVATGRTWFPTAHRAVEQHLRVKIGCRGTGRVQANGSCEILAA